MCAQRDADREKAQLREFLQSAVRECLAHRSAWPFKEPVDTTEVEDYTTIVSDPIGTTTIRPQHHHPPRQHNGIGEAPHVLPAGLWWWWQTCL